QPLEIGNKAAHRTAIGEVDIRVSVTNEAVASMIDIRLDNMNNDITVCMAGGKVNNFNVLPVHMKFHIGCKSNDGPGIRSAGGAFLTRLLIYAFHHHAYAYIVVRHDRHAITLEVFVPSRMVAMYMRVNQEPDVTLVQFPDGILYF